MLTHKRYGLAMLLMFAGIAAVAHSWHPPLPTRIATPESYMWLIMGCFLLMGTLFLYPMPPQTWQFHQGMSSWTFGKFKNLLTFSAWYQGIVFGSGAGLLLYFSYQTWTWEPGLPLISETRQIQLFFGGMVLLVLGSLNREAIASIGQTLTESWQNYRHEWLLAGFLTLMGFAVRVYRLDNLFPLLYGDEPPYMMAARRVYEGESYHLAQPLHLAGTYLSAFLNATGMRLFGADLFGYRIVTVIIGTLAIPGVYLLARRILNWQAGLAAAVILIGLPLHVHFSRYALNNIYDSTFGVYAILLIWNALEGGHAWKWVLAGALIGLSLWFYTGALLWLILLPAWLGYLLLSQPRKMLPHLPGMLAGILVVLLVWLPNLIYSHQMEMSVFRRVNQVQTESTDFHIQSFMTENVNEAVRAYIDLPDVSLHFEIKGQTALTFRWTLVLLCLGVVVALRYALHPPVLLILAWLGLATLFAGALTLDRPWYARYVTVAIPMSVLMGCGVAWLIQLLPTRPNPKIPLVIGIGLLLVVSWQNLFFSLKTHPEFLKKDFEVERWRGNGLAMATLETTREGVINYWLVSGDSAYNLRYVEIYTALSGLAWQSPRLRVVQEAITSDWLKSLELNQEVVLYVAPVAEDNPSPGIYRGENHPVWVILAAYPDAHAEPLFLQMYFLKRGVDPFYTRVVIPPNAVYSSPEH